MAKKKSKGAARSAAEQSSAAESAPPNPTVARVRWIVLGVALAGAIVAVLFHRRADPARAWAREVETRHVALIETPLARCFGAADGAAIRRAIPDVRRGSYPAGLRHCAGPALTELVQQPITFSHSLENSPPGVDDARQRERSTLSQLSSSLGRLQLVAGDIAVGGAIPETSRDGIAGALEDIAVYTDQEKSTFSDLLQAAQDAGSVL
jgi:hypothetical protein